MFTTKKLAVIGGVKFIGNRYQSTWCHKSRKIFVEFTTLWSLLMIPLGNQVHPIVYRPSVYVGLHGR